MKKPKAIHKNTLIGQQGVNYIATVVNNMGYLWTPTGGASDAGIDGFIEIRDPATGTATNLIIQVQSKATVHPWDKETALAFEYRCDERDIDYWLQGNAPVILVVSRPKDNLAYWVSVKDYFQDLTRRKSKRIVFDKSLHHFTTGSSLALQHLAAPMDSGLYLAPPPISEQLISNLLPVSRYPQTIYRADTHHRKNESLWESMEAKKATYGPAWMLAHQQIISFYNLKLPPWKDECDQTTVEEFHSDEWAYSHELPKKSEFIRLLKMALREDLRVRWIHHYHPKRGKSVLYFAKTKDLSPRELRWKRLKEAKRTVFGPHYGKNDPSRIIYYRHLAFEPAFVRFDGQWHLQITPTYHFTSDGKKPSGYRDSYLKGIKRLEKHSSVRDNVEFLASFLTEQDLFAGSPHLTFAELRHFETDFGIAEQDWVSRADEDEKASLGQNSAEIQNFTLE